MATWRRSWTSSRPITGAARHRRGLSLGRRSTRRSSGSSRTPSATSSASARSACSPPTTSSHRAARAAHRVGRLSHGATARRWRSTVSSRSAARCAATRAAAASEAGWSSPLVSRREQASPGSCRAPSTANLTDSSAPPPGRLPGCSTSPGSQGRRAAPSGPARYATVGDQLRVRARLQRRDDRRMVARQHRAENLPRRERRPGVAPPDRPRCCTTSPGRRSPGERPCSRSGRRPAGSRSGTGRAPGRRRRLRPCAARGRRGTGVMRARSPVTLPVSAPSTLLNSSGVWARAAAGVGLHADAGELAAALAVAVQRPHRDAAEVLAAGEGGDALGIVDGDDLTGDVVLADHHGDAHPVPDLRGREAGAAEKAGRADGGSRSAPT